jgi:rhodanese-related sulfurtransferase
MSEADSTPKEISRAEAREMLDKGAQLVDVRADHEWETGHLPGAVHIPLAELPAHLGEIDKDRPVIFYCRGGNSSGSQSQFLSQISKLLG